MENKFLKQWDRTAWLWSFTFLLVFFSSLALAWFTLPGQHLYDLDIIELVPVLSVDDAYRYFLAKQAWSDSSLYSWNYILPLSFVLDVFFLVQHQSFMDYTTQP